MIAFCDVTYKYPYDEFSVLENTSFEFRDGINTLLCNFQSGKTTICKLILGLLVPQKGSVVVDGVIPDKKNPPDVLYIPQNPVFFQHKSVLFNLNYPAKVRKITPQNDVYALAEKFALSKKLDCKVKTLSSEEKLRLALARGLTIPRKTVLFDGFFDNTCDMMFDDVLSQFQAAVILTANPQNAKGKTTVLDGKQAIFVGEAERAREIAKSVWI